MMRFYFFLLLAFSFLYAQLPFFPPGQPGGGGSPEVMRLNSPPFTLIVFSKPISWSRARDVCGQSAMVIASIHSPEENMKVISLLNGVRWGSGVWHGAWIGLTDEGSKGVWRWVDGTPLDFKNFVPGEPNGVTCENYGAIELARAGRPDGWWNDANINESYAAVVCRVSVAVSAPAQRLGGSSFVPGSKVVLSVDRSTCPVGGFVKSFRSIRGGYECVEFQGGRWIKPFDEKLSLYTPVNLGGDFSLEFNYYAFRPGCPYVRVTLFGEKVLKDAEAGGQYALGGPSFISLRGSCDRFEAGITDNPRLDANAMLEYRRNVPAETVHRVAVEVRNGTAKVYLNGKKIASEPFTAVSRIRGIGIYFFKHYTTEKPYSDYPALIGDIRLALYEDRTSGLTTVEQRPVPGPSAPQPLPPPQARQPAYSPPPVERKSVKCIESVGVGEASVIGGDRASAKVEALARAKWDAIEKALGVTTSVKTIIHNFRLLDEVIRNEVGGFIKDIKVLKEENFTDMVRVKIKGCVYPNEAEKALSLISRDTAFSVMVLVKRPQAVEFDEMNPVTTELINILNQQGFKVYDLAGNPNVNPYDIENIIAQRRFITLRAYMSRVLSGAMVVGKVELVPSTRAGQDIGYGIRATFNVVTARLSYYLLTRDRQGLRIVASGSLSALGRAPNVRDAEYRAMEALAKKLGGDIMGKIERFMASKRKIVTVVIKGVRSTTQNFSIKEKLQRVPWVQSVEDLGLGKFNVTYLENTVYLANAVERMPELKLIRFSPTEVEAELL